MLAYEIGDYPHQAFDITLSDGRTVTLRLRYNQLHDTWSMTVWDGGICPLCAGRKILAGQDLFRSIASISDSLVLIKRDGADVLAGNQYGLFTKRVNGPLAFLVLLSPEEVEGLRNGALQPCC